MQWGVTLVGPDWIAVTEASETLPPPDVVSVAASPRDGRLAVGWNRRTTFPFPDGHLGRWSWAQNTLRQSLTDVMRRRRLPLPPNSPLARERQWVLAQRIMQIARKPHGAAISLAELREALDVMMNVVERSVRATWAGGGQQIDSHDIRWMHEQLKPETGELLHAPWPAPDQPGSPGRWQWQRYSPDLTRTILTKVLSDAVTGYRDLVDRNFAGFGWALGLNSVLPVHIEGAVAMPADDHDGTRSSLSYQLKPDRTASQEAPPRVQLDLLTQPGPGQTLSIYASQADRTRTPFYVPTSHSTLLPTGQSRPATNLAYEWLAADLHALGWVDHALRFHD